MDLGLEPAIGIRANQLLQSGKPFKDAIDTAVKEAREKVDKLKSNTPAAPLLPPAGAVGEQGANNLPAPITPPKEETPEEEIAAEKARKRKLDL